MNLYAYTYRGWQVFLVPCREGWAFHVYTSETEEDSLFDGQLYLNPEVALSYAQQFIDFRIDYHETQRRIFAALDAKLERAEIDTVLYVRVVQFLRDGLSFDRTKSS